MGFIDTLKERAKANVKTIVLPETEDKRTLAATEKILKEGIAKVILVGNEEAVKKSAAEDGYFRRTDRRSCYIRENTGIH